MANDRIDDITPTIPVSGSADPHTMLIQVLRDEIKEIKSNGKAAAPAAGLPRRDAIAIQFAKALIGKINLLEQPDITAIVKRAFDYADAFIAVADA